MRTKKRVFVLGIASLFLFAIFFVLPGCSELTTPMDPNSQEGLLEIASAGHVEENDFEIISFGNVVQRLKKIISTSETIENDKTGKLKIKEKILLQDGGKVKINVSLRIFKDSLPVDKIVLAMSIDDESFLGDLDMTFGPHGFEFLTPAELNVEIDGLHLEDCDPNSIDIYYSNPATGEWEIMESDGIKIKVDDDGAIKKIQVNKAQLPHFSRYALIRR